MEKEMLLAQWNCQNGDPVLGIFAPGTDKIKRVNREVEAQCFGKSCRDRVFQFNGIMAIQQTEMRHIGAGILSEQFFCQCIRI